MVLLIATIVTVTSFNHSIQVRTQLTFDEIKSWVSKDYSPTSVSLRLEMYKLAIEKIDDVPFFGHGYRTSNIVVFKNAQSPGGRLSYTYNHLHNAYLTNYFNGGIVLLGALLLLLFAPFILFLKANSQNRTNPVFIVGALLTVGYASFGMINILLGDTYMNGFYTFFLAIFMLLYAQSVKISST